MNPHFLANRRLPLAEVRRAEQHQETMVSGLLGADHSPLATTIGYEQVAMRPDLLEQAT